MFNNFYGYIYIVKDLISNRIYVGQKKGLFCKSYYGSGKIIKSYINKYGKSRFFVQPIDGAYSKDELNELEIYWIKKLDCIYPKGFNLTSGGETGEQLPSWKGIKRGTPTELHKLKNRIGHIGIKHSKEDCLAKSIRMKGHKVSEETKEKIRLTKIGNKNPMYGKVVSEETRNKLRIAGLKRKGIMHTEETKLKISRTKKEYYAKKKNNIK